MNKEIVSKGMRLKKPTIMRVELRAEVYEWLCNCATDFNCGVNLLARGIIEDCFDKSKSTVSADDDKKSQ